VKKNKTIQVLSTEVKVKTIDENDFICLTDIAKSKNPDRPDDLIRNWLRNRNTLELLVLGIWELLHNPDFNPVEFDGIRKQAGLNSFTLTPKQWIAATQSIGLSSKAGRYGGTPEPAASGAHQILEPYRHQANAHPHHRPEHSTTRRRKAMSEIREPQNTPNTRKKDKEPSVFSVCSVVNHMGNKA